MIRHICPVCGYPDLEDPPYDLYGAPSFAICPCCGCPRRSNGKKRRGNFVDVEGLPGYPPQAIRTSNGATKVNAYPKGASPYGVLDMAGNLREFIRQEGVAKGRNGRYARQQYLWAEHLLARETSEVTLGPKDALCFRLALDRLDPHLWHGARLKKRTQKLKLPFRLWKR